MSRLQRSTFIALQAAILAVLASCGGGGGGSDDACDQVVCGNGRCVVNDGQAACECNAGFHPEGLTCVGDTDPCRPNPCVQPNRTQCSKVNGQAVCSCDPGTQDVGGVCVAPNPCRPNPCTKPNQTVCSVSSGQAVCSCISGHIPDPAGNGCKPDQVVTCAGQHNNGDSYEPDECPALARDIGTSGTQNEQHSLDPANDEDWFRLSATAGRIYEVRANGGPGVKLIVDLYAADGTTVVASDNSGKVDVTLAYKATASGALYARVRAFSNAERGNYSISIADLGTDEYADEVAQATAVALSSGVAVPGALQFGGDRDVVKFALVAGRSFRFEAAWTAASTTELRLELIAPDQTTVVIERQSATPSMVARIPVAGDYFLRIQSPEATARGGYTFTVTDLGADDHGDTPAEASPVVIGGPLTPGKFEHPDDVDVFVFQAQAGRIYAFTCNPGGGAVDCTVSLSDTAGTVLATDNNGGTGYVAHEFAQAGTFYFSASAGVAGTYTYKLEDLGPDDHGDTIATASARTVGAPAESAKLETPGDRDVFSFSATANRIYEIGCTTANFDCNVVVTDAAGTTIVSDTESANDAKVRMELSTAGTYYFRIESGTPSFGSYSSYVNDVGADDHGDTRATATSISPPILNGTGQIELAGDVDWFSFSAEAGHIYEFTCTSTAGDCNLDLVDSNGVVLSSDNASSTTARVSHEVLLAGTFYAKVSFGSSSAKVGSYTWQLKDLGGDDHGDTPATATNVPTLPGSGNGRIETVGDVDVFSFSATAGRIYEASCSSTSEDCNVELVNSAGVVLASDTGVSFSAKAAFKAGAAGTYFVKVSFGETSSAKVGTYTWQLKDLGLDDHGDTPATATAITPAGNGRIETVGDVDVLSINATAGRIYRVTCTSASGDCDIELVNAAGTVLASDTSTSAASLVYRPTAAGTYFVKLSFKGDTTAQTGSYSWQFEDLGVDDHGDTQATATPIIPAASNVGAKLDVQGDVDWLSFPALAGHTYLVSCSTPSFDCNLSVHDPSGKELVSDTRPDNAASVRVRVQTAGTYAVRIQSGNSSFDTYSYRVEDLGVDDHGDTRDSATNIWHGYNTTSKIQVADDVDWFSFTAVAGHIYEFSCDGPNFVCTVTLVNASGTQLTVVSAGSGSNVAKVAYEIETAGTYYLRVSSGNAAAGTYQPQFRDMGLDDHGDIQAAATTIPADQTLKQAKLETPTDGDWFSFTVQAGHVLDFACTGMGFDCNLSLHDASGTTLVSDTTESANAQVAYEFTTAGTYFVKVFSNGTTFGTYQYQLADRGVDDHGDTADSATALALGTGKGGRLEFGGDADFFSVSLAAGTAYSVTSTQPSVTLTLYAPDKTTVLGTGASPRNFTSAAAGTYYVRVTGKASAYSVTVKAGTTLALRR